MSAVAEPVWAALARIVESVAVEPSVEPTLWWAADGLWGDGDVSEYRRFAWQLPIALSFEPTLAPFPAHSATVRATRALLVRYPVGSLPIEHVLGTAADDAVAIRQSLETAVATARAELVALAGIQVQSITVEQPTVAAAGPTLVELTADVAVEWSVL